jgi:hypothetical protein
MAFWSTQTSEPLRQYRWVVNFGASELTAGTLDDLVYALKKVDKPKAKVGEITHKYLNHFFYYPGRLEWETINMTFAAMTQPSATELVNNVLIGAGYGVPTGPIGTANLASIGKRKFSNMIGGKVDISQINPDGDIVETWRINNPFFTSVQFGSLDYGSEEIVEITCTVRYDWAQLITINPIEDGAAPVGPDFPTR